MELVEFYRLVLIGTIKKLPAEVLNIGSNWFFTIILRSFVYVIEKLTEIIVILHQAEFRVQKKKKLINDNDNNINS